MSENITVEFVDGTTVPGTDGQPAPYGMTKDNKPRGKPGPKPGLSRAPVKTRPTGPPPPGRKPGPPKSALRPDYRPGIMGLAQIPLGLAAGMGARSRTMLATAAAGTVYVPPMVDAINEIAQENQQVAAICEKITAIGPWGLFVGAAVPLVLQILVNHGVMPAGLGGTVPPETIIEIAAAQSPALTEISRLSAPAG